MDWSTLIDCREQIHKAYPSIWALKMIKRPSRFIRRQLRPGMRVLDVGAAERRMERHIRETFPDVVYKSMDVDRGFPHDYYSLDEVNERFDMIILLEVVEHLELEAGINMLGRLRDLLVDGGQLVISTPNIYHPTRFWQTSTHKVAYSYEELGGILLSQGFEVLGIYRTFNASFPKYLVRLTLFYPLHRIINVDFAKSIVIVAQRGQR